MHCCPVLLWDWSSLESEGIQPLHWKGWRLQGRLRKVEPPQGRLFCKVDCFEWSTCRLFWQVDLHNVDFLNVYVQNVKSWNIDFPNFTVRVWGLGLGLGWMCWNVDHVDVNLPTHSAILPSTFWHSQWCGSSPLQVNLVPSASFDLTSVDISRSTLESSP